MKARASVSYGLIFAVVVATLEALLPVSRLLSKIGGEVYRASLHVFVAQSLPRLAVILSIAVVALTLHLRNYRAGWALLIALPLIALLIDFLFRASPIAGFFEMLFA